MAKILYPIGTAVQIRDWKSKELQNETGVELSTGKRIVTDYRKGDARPYVVSTVDDHGRNASKRFSVKEIKSWREVNRTSSKPINVYDRHDRTATQSTLTRQEVNEIVKLAVEDARADLAYNLKIEISKLHDHLVDDADIIAREVVHEHTLSEDE